MNLTKYMSKIGLGTSKIFEYRLQPIPQKWALYMILYKTYKNTLLALMSKLLTIFRPTLHQACILDKHLWKSDYFENPLLDSTP